MKVFTYFVEPASYTIDLIKNIHYKLNIDSIFIKNNSHVKSDIDLGSFNFLTQFFWLQKFLFIRNKRKSNDLIIINGYNNYVFILTFLFNIFSFIRKKIAIESDSQLREPKSLFLSFFKNLYLNIIFRNKHVLGFAGGSINQKALFRYYGMSEDRIFLLPLVVNNDQYFLDKKTFPAKFTFLYVGRLLNTKNVNVLCEKFISSFYDKNAELIIVGFGKNLNRYKKKYKHNKIKFLGAIYGQELISIYQNASVFVFPSNWEQWGLVINEALSSGLPVISHKNVGAVDDLILNKNTGFIISNWDDLEEKMILLYNDRELCENLSHSALMLMKNYWNYNLYKENLLNVIEKVKFGNIK